MLAYHTFFHRIRVVELKKALKQMKTEKITGLDDIGLEMLRRNWRDLVNEALQLDSNDNENLRCMEKKCYSAYIYKNKGDTKLHQLSWV